MKGYECLSRVRSIKVRRSLPDGRTTVDKANPITPILDLTTGHVHMPRLGPIEDHFGGMTIARFDRESMKVSISPRYEENLVFYELACKLGVRELGIEASPEHWDRFCRLRKVLDAGQRPTNLPEDFWHPHARELRASWRGAGQVVDMAKVLGEGVEGDELGERNGDEEPGEPREGEAR